MWISEGWMLMKPTLLDQNERLNTRAWLVIPAIEVCERSQKHCGMQSE
jgi:hypothetical protein